MPDDKNKIIESSFLMDMRTVKPFEVEEDKDERIILDDNLPKDSVDIKQPVVDNKNYTFKQGDLVVPSTGLNDAFFYRKNMNLNEIYNYRKASDAEYVYYMKNIRNGQSENVKSFTDIQNKTRTYFDKKNNKK